MGYQSCHCWMSSGYLSNRLPSGKLTYCYGKSLSLMGKLTISMAIFNSYVELPEGIWAGGSTHFVLDSPYSYDGWNGVPYFQIDRLRKLMGDQWEMCLAPLVSPKTSHSYLDKFLVMTWKGCFLRIQGLSSRASAKETTHWNYTKTFKPLR